MGSRRTLILVGAILVGAIAGLLVMNYVGGVEERANGENALVQVVVVSGQVDKGTAADQMVAANQLIIDERRQKDLPTGAVTSLDALTGQVAVIDLSNGEIVTTNKFAATAAAVSSTADRLPEGEVAITISVDQIHGVGNMVFPGDHVNMMVSIEDPNPAEGEEATTGMAHMFQNVAVIAAGTNFGEPVVDAEGNEVAPEASGLLTLSVTPEAAQYIALAQNKGSIYLTLVRPNYEPHAIPPLREPIAVLPGELGLTPSAAPATAESGG